MTYQGTARTPHLCSRWNKSPSESESQTSCPGTLRTHLREPSDTRRWVSIRRMACPLVATRGIRVFFEAPALLRDEHTRLRLPPPLWRETLFDSLVPYSQPTHQSGTYFGWCCDLSPSGLKINMSEIYCLWQLILYFSLFSNIYVGSQLFLLCQ